MADYAPRVRRLLREAGCLRQRQAKGDHEIWFSPKTKRRFPVDAKIRSRHTANGILKQAGLPKAFCLRTTRDAAACVQPVETGIATSLRRRKGMVHGGS